MFLAAFVTSCLYWDCGQQGNQTQVQGSNEWGGGVGQGAPRTPPGSHHLRPQPAGSSG